MPSLQLLLPQKLSDRAELHPTHVCTCRRCISISTNISEGITALVAFTQHPTCFLNSKTCKHLYHRKSHHAVSNMLDMHYQEKLLYTHCCVAYTDFELLHLHMPLQLSRQPINIWQQQADVPHKAGVNVSCSTSMHAQWTRGKAYLWTTKPGRSSRLQKGVGGGGRPTGTSQ